MFAAAVEGLSQIVQPWPLTLMLAGIVLSSIFAALPGVGVLMLITIALPYSITLDPFPAIALLLGIAVVSNTANTFPSVLIAVPGSGGAQATIVDGHPMARRGEAKRAFGAAFAASALGGIFGAMVLFATIPVLRPFVLSFRSPEFMMLVIWGLSAVATLSGNAPIKGLVVAALGVFVSTIGVDTKTGVERYDLGGMYLWDGIDLVLVGLGIFAIPEMIALAVRRTAIAENPGLGSGLWQGVRDVLRNWWLVIRCSTIGVWIGVLPGLGGSVADWFAYAHAVQTEKNNENFGKGDVRGVIAPESSNNAKEGGALIPTIAFGIPGSTSFALVLAAFIAVGIDPGRAMLSEQLSYTMAMIWVLVLGNLIAAALAMAASRPFAEIALLPFFIVVPTIIVLSVSSSFAASYIWWDVLTLVVFSVLGYLLKLLDWPRPPFLVAVVLGAQLEQSLFITQARYGWAWVDDPIVLAIFALIVVTLVLPQIRKWRRREQGRTAPPIVRSRSIVVADIAFALALAVGFGTSAAVAYGWDSIRAALIVYCLAAIAVPLLMLQIARNLRTLPGAPPRAEAAPGEFGDMPGDVVTRRTLEIFGWLVGLAAATLLIGFHVSIALFGFLYVMTYSRRLVPALIVATFGEAFLIVVFDNLLRASWPTPLLLQLF